MKLNQPIKKRFRTIGHQLKPVVTIANNGVTDNILTELDRALEDHELIKVKIAIPDREERQSVRDFIAKESKAEVIDTIGKIVLCYRAAKQPNKKLSNLLRFSEC